MARATSTGSGGRPSGEQPASPARFLRESWGELRKVQWPTFEQVFHATVVVFFVTAAFAIFLTVVDLAIAKLVTQAGKLL